MSKLHGKSIDPYCDTCIKGGFVQRAVGFCQNCVDFLCKDCLDRHTHHLSTDQHIILTSAAMPARQAEKPLKYDPCVRHPLELKDSYCLEHGTIICGNCALAEHRQCDVKPIILAYKNFNITAEDQALKDSINSFLSHAQQLQMTLEENLVELEKQKNNLIKESKDFLENITRSCEDFERKVLKKYMENKCILAEKLTQVTDVVSSVEATTDALHLQNIKKLGEAKYFIHLKAHTDTILEYSDKLNSLYGNLSYVDMVGKFYLCITPPTEPGDKLLHITLDSHNYDYENTVPDIHIPCRNKLTETRANKTRADRAELIGTPTLTIRQSKTEAPTDEQNITTLSTVEQPLNRLSTSKTDSRENSNIRGKASTDNQEKYSEADNPMANSDLLTTASISRISSKSSMDGSFTDDQMMKGPSGNPFQNGAENFRRLSVALGASARYQPSNIVTLQAINVGVHGDKRASLVLGVDITPDGSLLVLDKNNRRLKMFTQDGEYKASRKLPDNPEGVAVISDTRAAVSTLNNLIGILDITSGLALKKTIDLEYKVWGIAGYRDHLIVTCSPSAEATQAPTTVRMIDMQGRVKWSVNKDKNDADLFQWAGFLTVRYGIRDTVIITDQFKQTITVLSAHNGSVVKVGNIAGKTPMGVASDEDCDVFVCYDSGSVCLWSVDMSQETSPGTVDLKSPSAMAYDKKQKLLYVASHSDEIQYSDYIHRYHFRK